MRQKLKKNSNWETSRGDVLKTNECTAIAGSSFCQYLLKRGVSSAAVGAAPAEPKGIVSAQNVPGSDLNPLISVQREGESQEQLQQRRLRAEHQPHTQSQGCSAANGHANIKLKVMAEPFFSLLSGALGFHLPDFLGISLVVCRQHRLQFR